MGTTLNLYEKDFYKWTIEQAHLIKTKAFDKLDIEHLFDEVEDMGNRHADEIESRLTVLLMHLLKWKYQPGNISSSWTGTIREQRLRIAMRLKKMPSLKGKLAEIIEDAYKVAVIRASTETGINETIFPVSCEWKIKQILDDKFFPN